MSLDTQMTLALLLAHLILWRITLTKQQNVKRLRNSGLSWAVVGPQLGVSGTTAKRWATA